MYRNIYNNPRLIQQNKDALLKVIDKGINFMEQGRVGEDFYQIWNEYALDILKIIDNDNGYSLYINYLKFNATLNSSGLHSREKMHQSIKYLIEMMKSV